MKKRTAFIGAILSLIPLGQPLITKSALGDYYGAISDYSKSIKIDSNDSFPYYFRGLAKKEIGDLNGACSDWEKASTLGDNVSAKLIKDQCER